MIHPTAVIDPSAEVDSDVEIGPWCYVGPDVRILQNTRLLNNATIIGRTTIGRGCHIGSFCVLGGIPQDPKYKFELTNLTIGDNNRLHEFVTIHSGTNVGSQETKVGDSNIIMAYCHIGHDCRIGNRTKIASYAALSGHAEVDDHAVVGGMVAISQRRRIGKYAYVTGRTAVTEDVPPFSIADGTNSKPLIRGVNVVGLRRAGYGPVDLQTARRVLETWLNPEFSSELASENIARMSDAGVFGAEFIAFVRRSGSNLLRRTTDSGH